jgi:hypothetical protein
MNVKRGLRVVAAGAVGLVLVGVGATPSLAAEFWTYERTGKGNASAQEMYLTVNGPLQSGPGASMVVEPLSGSGNQQWTFWAPAEAGGNYIIRSGGSTNQYALSISGNSSANGTKVVQWNYEPSNKYEQWHQDDSNGRRYKNIGTNKCLAVAGGTASTVANGAQVIIWDCGSGLDQQWADIPA